MQVQPLVTPPPPVPVQQPVQFQVPAIVLLLLQVLKPVQIQSLMVAPPPVLAQQTLQPILPAAPPPRFRKTFDGTPGQLAYFLNRVWAHIDRYRDQYPTNRDLILVIVDGMNGGEARQCRRIRPAAPRLLRRHGTLSRG